MREAEHWETRGAEIRCRLCPHRCLIEKGQSGLCRVRTNRGGKLTADSWGRVAAMHVDPIEKKPLYHFRPGTGILSIGTYGCSFACGFCQNWQLVDGFGRVEELSPERLLAAARESGGIGVAYTYNEPLIWFEYLMDTAPLLREHGLAVVLVTNGFVEQAALHELLPHVDAMNVDLKSMDKAFYREHCNGRLAPVLRTIEKAAASTHVEVTNLLVTGENTDETNIRALVDFVASVSPAIPLHFSRYFPQREFDAAPTPESVMETAYRIGREKLHHVYLGNVGGAAGSDTFCPGCGAVTIERSGTRTRIAGLNGDRCAACGAAAEIVIE